MVSLIRLRAIIEREIHNKTPNAIELRMPEEVLILPAEAQAVVNEILVRGTEEVEIVKIDSTYLPDHDFLYALTVEVR
jgi:hypothetical protein